MASRMTSPELFKLEEMVEKREQARLLLDMIDHAIENSRGALVLMGSLLQRQEMLEPTDTGPSPERDAWKLEFERLQSIEGALYGAKSLGEEYLIAAQQHADAMYDDAAAAAGDLKDHLTDRMIHDA
jgi:hypothetical protein